MSIDRLLDRSLPAAPRLVSASETELPAPTPQERPTDKDGGPLEALSTCRWCGGMHPTACPFLKIVEWHPTGQIARVVLKERPELEKAILYPFEEEDDDLLKRALIAIAQADTLEHAQGLARALVGSIAEEKPA